MGTKVITVFAKKGGVGKTTITQNLASYFAAAGKRVLCVDLDEQGNLTQFFLGSSTFHNQLERNTLSAILNPNFDPEPEDVILQPKNVDQHRNISVLSASMHLKQYLLPEAEWDDEISFSLRDFLDDIEGTFDFVFIDTPPAVDTLQTWVGLLAANYAISPVEPEAYSSQSLHGGDLRIAEARRANPRLSFLGFVVNLKKARRSLHQQYEQQLRDLRGDQVFETTFRDLAAFPEAVTQQMSVLDWEPKSDAAQLLRDLGQEVTMRIERQRFQKQSDQKINSEIEAKRKAG